MSDGSRSTESIFAKLKNNNYRLHGLGALLDF